MPHYRYQALNAEQQIVQGEVPADNVAAAVARLEAEGLIVQSISAVTPESSSEDVGPEAERSGEEERSSVEQSVLESHLATVLARGQSIVPALRAYAEEIPAGRQRRKFHAMLQVLERGDAATAVQALAVWPEYWIPLLSAATAARDPARVLHEFLEQSQRAVQLRKQWWLSFAYPLAVAGIAAIVLIALSLLVVPVFRDLFREFSLQLPPPTQVVLTVAEWITTGRVLWIVALLVLSGLLCVVVSRTLPSSRQDWFGDRFGTLFGRANAIARFAQFAADLLEAGLAVPSALRIAGYCTRSARLKRGAWRLATEVEEGGSPFPQRQPLTNTVRHALQSEMSTAARIHLLRELSLCHHARAQVFLSWTRGLIEPITIVVIGSLIGLTLISLFMPLFRLISVLSA